MLDLVSILLLNILVLWETEASRVCYEAKICLHNGKERCGVDSKGEARRFIDFCDLLEFNCLKGTDYSLAESNKCTGLPPIPSDDQVLKQSLKQSKIVTLERKNRTA